MTDFQPCQPPHNNEAELCLLGSCLRYGAFAEVAAALRAEDFFRDAHQRIFKAMGQLHGAGKAINPVTVFDQVESNGDMPDVTRGYFVDVERHFASARQELVAIVKSKAMLRALQKGCFAVLREIDQPSMPDDEVVDMAERLIFEIGQRRAANIEFFSVPQVMNETGDRLETRYRATREGRHGAVGIPSGFVDLDFLIGGFQDTELTIVAARPSVGKTALGLNLFYNFMALQGVPCLFVSLEQGRLELGDRFYSRDARVSSHKIRTGMFDDRDQEALAKSRAKFQSFAGWINDRPGLTVSQIASQARRLKTKDGLRAVLIDYLQLIEPENKREQRHLQVGEISRRLKLLAKELAIPVLAMAQLNRSSEDRRPRLSDLRESGAIEQDADNVILLHNPNRHEQQDGATPNGPIEVIVAKQRQASPGLLKLFFEREFCKFENLAS